MSQMALALEADVSPRHVSFLESGRSRPSRAMVARLCTALDVPPAARNRLFLDAGLAPQHSEELPEGEARDAVEAAVGWMLERHDPYPAIVIDRHWRLVQANRVAEMLLEPLGVAEGGSLVDALEVTAAAGILVNAAEVAHHTRTRLAHESAHFGGDAVLDAAVRQIDQLFPRGDAAEDMPPFLTVRYRLGETDLALFSVLSQFASAYDVGLSEMRVELMFPADNATRGFLEAL